MTTLDSKKLFSFAAAFGAIFFNQSNYCAALANTENRHYDISIDGKPAGSYVLSIDSMNNNIEVTSDCNVHHKVLIINYNYKYHGHESYKNGRLSAFSSNCDDNGKHTEISIKRGDDDILHSTVNGKTGTVDGDAILSSYWSLPKSNSTDPSEYNSKYFEVDTGRTFKGKLKFLGNQSLNIGGRPLDCKRFVLSGGDDEELWYANGRMVRQKTSNLGKTTTIELTKLD